MRLIDAEHLIQKAEQEKKDGGLEDEELEIIYYELSDEPTVEAIPIEWLRKHMITHDEVVNGDYYADEAIELNLYVSDLIDKWQAERKEE